MAATAFNALSIAPALSGKCISNNNTGFRAFKSRCYFSASGPRLSVKAMGASKVLTQDDLKKLAADKAVEYVESGMVLGLGTGSTAAFVVAKIGELMKSGALKDIIGIPTSKRTAEQAASLGIPLSVLDDHPKIDLAIDGADEVDPELNLVKGRGGALLREKMVEAASSKFVVVVDESKLVEGLGGSKLAMPVEVECDGKEMFQVPGSRAPTERGRQPKRGQVRFQGGGQGHRDFTLSGSGHQVQARPSGDEKVSKDKLKHPRLHLISRIE